MARHSISFVQTQHFVSYAHLFPHLSDHPFEHLPLFSKYWTQELQQQPFGRRRSRERGSRGDKSDCFTAAIWQLELERELMASLCGQITLDNDRGNLQNHQTAESQTVGLPREIWFWCVLLDDAEIYGPMTDPIANITKPMRENCQPFQQSEWTHPDLWQWNSSRHSTLTMVCQRDSKDWASYNSGWDGWPTRSESEQSRLCEQPQLIQQTMLLSIPIRGMVPLAVKPGEHQVGRIGSNAAHL